MEPCPRCGAYVIYKFIWSAGKPELIKYCSCGYEEVAYVNFYC